MTKTKKRAAKRAAAKPKLLTPPKCQRWGFNWPHPLVAQYKIKNIKAYREYHQCSLGLALAAYNKETEQLCLF